MKLFKIPVMISRMSNESFTRSRKYRNAMLKYALQTRLLAKTAARFAIVERHGVRRNSASIRGAARNRSGDASSDHDSSDQRTEFTRKRNGHQSRNQPLRSEALQLITSQERHGQP